MPKDAETMGSFQKPLDLVDQAVDSCFEGLFTGAVQNKERSSSSKAALKSLQNIKMKSSWPPGRGIETVFGEQGALDREQEHLLGVE